MLLNLLSQGGTAHAISIDYYFFRKLFIIPLIVFQSIIYKGLNYISPIESDENFLYFSFLLFWKLLFVSIIDCGHFMFIGPWVIMSKIEVWGGAASNYPAASIHYYINTDNHWLFEVRDFNYENILPNFWNHLL